MAIYYIIVCKKKQKIDRKDVDMEEDTEEVNDDNSKDKDYVYEKESDDDEDDEDDDDEDDEGNILLALLTSFLFPGFGHIHALRLIY